MGSASVLLLAGACVDRYRVHSSTLEFLYNLTEVYGIPIPPDAYLGGDWHFYLLLYGTDDVAASLRVYFR